MVGLGQVDLNEKSIYNYWLGQIIKMIFFLYETMRKENRSHLSGGKQGEINLTFENQPFLTRLASCGRYSSDTTCHTPVLRTEPKPPYECQDVQIIYMTNNMVNIYNISLNYKLESLQNDPWVQKKGYRVAWKYKCGWSLHRRNQRWGMPSLRLLARTGTLDLTPYLWVKLKQW
jgi:hypothetical protein